MFTKEFPPELKGIAIANSELVRKACAHLPSPSRDLHPSPDPTPNPTPSPRQAHNSFARPEPFVAEEKQAGDVGER